MFKDKSGRELTSMEATQKVTNRVASIFLDFELYVLWIVGYIPSHLVRLLFYHIFGITIGKGSRIHMGCRFFDPSHISIGQDTIIGDHAFLDGRAALSIGSHVDIASQVLIYNSKHDINTEDFHAVEKEVIIEDYVFIGPRAIILPGVRVGRGAVVAAGAVVTKDILPFMIVGGVPAREMGERLLKEPRYRLGRARLFQ